MQEYVSTSAELYYLTFSKIFVYIYIHIFYYAGICEH